MAHGCIAGINYGIYLIRGDTIITGQFFYKLVDVFDDCIVHRSKASLSTGIDHS